MLGYTQFSWDNESDNVKQPAAASKYWNQLTANEKAAAMVLGYTRKIWNNDSGSEPQPAAADKYWHQLTSCGEIYNQYMNR